MLTVTCLAVALFASPVPAPITAAPVAVAADALPANLFLAERPKDAKELRDAKSAARKGEPIVFRARIGGRAAPFVKDRAICIVIDDRLKSCDEIPGDTCPKPWDYCCEPKESLKASVATLQVVGTGGKPLKVAIEGANGLKPLTKIVVKGTVAEAGPDGLLVVNAEGIFLEKPAAK
jgi:hypothetical protein